MLVLAGCGGPGSGWNPMGWFGSGSSAPETLVPDGGYPTAQTDGRLPLARVEYVLGRSGAIVPRQTLARWADIAADQAYCDQAHLSRDMRRFTGYTPAHLRRQLAADDPALWPYRLSPADALRLFGPLDEA